MTGGNATLNSAFFQFFALGILIDPVVAASMIALLQSSSRNLPRHLARQRIADLR
jgi:hypothetical protein